jgi:transposase-like protein
MGRRPRRTFTEEQKRTAVDDYVSGRKTAAQVAADLAVAPDQVYKWKISQDERAKGLSAEELEAAGSRAEDITRIQELEAELKEARLLLAEKTIVEELLKKRLRSTNSQQRSELTGLIETMEQLAQKRKRVK